MKEDLKMLFGGLIAGVLRVLLYFLSIPIMLILMGFIAWIFGAL